MTTIDRKLEDLQNAKNIRLPNIANTVNGKELYRGPTTNRRSYTDAFEYRQDPEKGMNKDDHKTMNITMNSLEEDFEKKYGELISEYSAGNNATIEDEKQPNINNVNNITRHNITNIVREKELYAQPTTNILSFTGVEEYHKDSEKWYEFLEDLYSKFSEYQIQKDRHKYNVADFNDWGRSEKPQGIVITKDVFYQYLNMLSRYNISGYDSAKGVTVTEKKLEELNHILNRTLKHKINIECKEPNIYIKGSYISIDEALSSSCVRNAITSERFKFLKIFATNTLFIDRDLLLSGRKLSAVIISPKWEVIGSRKIELNGSKGNDSATKSRAKDGVYPGNRGYDGVPGKPGGPAGSFFGIGEFFISGKNLTINANGGMGGRGQDGGNGMKGNNGRTPTVPTIKNTPCKDNHKELNGFNCQKMSYYFKPERCTYMGGGIFYCSPIYCECKYKIFGYSSGKGGDGGNGGRGGKGGNPGSIKVFEFNKKSEILRHNCLGSEGKNGFGGIGGVPGENGEDIIVSYTSKYDPNEWKLDEKIRNRSRAGINGVDGSNVRGMQDPEEAVDISNQQAFIINEYKNHLRENLSDPYVKHSLTQFLHMLDNNNEVKEVYNTLGLINELQSLEEQLHELSKNIDCIPFYRSLLKRISEYAQCPKSFERSRQYKKVLNYLYTSVLGRIYYLEDHWESDLIIDMKGYLDLVKKDIEKLKDLQNAKNKSDIIQRYKDEYKSNIDKKIAEAKKFIKKEITPEIDNVNSQIEEQVDLLINETIALEKKAEEEKRTLIKKKEDLENVLQLRGLFNFFKIASQVISFLGPVGAAVGSVIGSTSSVTESLLLEEHANQRQRVQLPPSILSTIRLLEDQIRSTQSRKITSLNKLLEQIIEETTKDSENLRDISEKITDIKKRLNKMLPSKFHFKEIRTLETELKDILIKKEGELKTKNIEIEKKADGSLAIVKKVKQIAQLAEVGFDIYAKYKNDKTKLNALTYAIEQAGEKFRQLKQYEERIYNTIAPMLQSMADNLQDAADKMEKKSQVALDVVKWRVQGTLKDIKLQIRQMTQGFQMTDSLVRCIERQEEVMTTLINVYDRIHSYKEQQNLVSYIEDINSTAGSSINITDPILVKAIRNLEMSILSNLVLKEYKLAIESFKQFVFPFAYFYLRKFTVPSHLELESRIGNLVHKVGEQIENIKSQVDIYKTSVKGYDKYIYTGEFNSNYISTKPFFVWTNEHYRDTISKLLSGQEVVVKSDITNSAYDKDAIKFCRLDLNFKAQNATTQSKITNVLKAFRVSATHFGNSYYKYDGKIYVIRSESQNIQYTFEKNSFGEPVFKNKVYDKIKEGDLMLSPYAMWKIRLINSTSYISFPELKIYEDKVDLELVGVGNFVNREDIDINLDVGKYYRPMDANFTEPKEIDASAGPTSNFCSSRLMTQAEEVIFNSVSNKASSLSSPINYVRNFLNSYTISVALNILSLMNQLFISKEESIENVSKNCDGGEISEVFRMSVDIEINNYDQISSNINLNKLSKQKNNDALVLHKDKNETLFSSKGYSGLIFPRDKETLAISRNNRSGSKWEPISRYSCNCNSHSLKSSLPNGQQDNYNIQIIPLPEMNNSLLLADLFSRSITGQKYKYSIDDSLFSPKQWIGKKISNGIAQSENDIIQSFYNFLSKFNDKSSMFDKAKSHLNSLLQFLGYLQEEDTDNYIHDIRNLFKVENV